MKRYLVFKFQQFYPLGGWFDFRGAFDSLDDAVKDAEAWEESGYAHVVDTETMSIVWGDD